MLAPQGIHLPVIATGVETNNDPGTREAAATEVLATTGATGTMATVFVAPHRVGGYHPDNRATGAGQPVQHDSTFAAVENGQANREPPTNCCFCDGKQTSTGIAQRIRLQAAE